MKPRQAGWSPALALSVALGVALGGCSASPDGSPELDRAGDTSGGVGSLSPLSGSAGDEAAAETSAPPNGGSAGTGTAGVGTAGVGTAGVGIAGAETAGAETAGAETAGLCSGAAAGPAQLRRLTGKEFKATLLAVFPQISGQWDSAFSGDIVSTLGYTNESGNLTVTPQNVREIDETGAALAGAVTASLGTLLPCSQTTPDRACAAEFINTYGKRLFRRPIAAIESEPMLTLFDEALSKTDFPTAIGWLTRSLIHSPAAVYRSEVGSANGGERVLSQYEVATALAFAFSGSPPSDALLARADAGELTSPEVLHGIAEQLINSPLGREHMQEFFGTWLEYARVTSVTKTSVSEFSALRNQMLEETRRFVEAVVFEAGGNLAAVLTSPTTYPSTELAAFYGMAAPATDYAQVTRPESAGIGILAQGSLLSNEASPNASSPTQRGLLVMEKLLCQQPPAVPPDIPNISPPALGERTTRQRYEDLHVGGGGSCATCHSAFDPIGYGFEHFDEAGRYRADEGGLEIDSAAHVPLQGATLFEFDGQVQLAEGLAASPAVSSCASQHLTAYAFGSQTACLGDSERELFEQGAIGFIEFLASMATAPQFVRRAAE